MDLKDLGFNRVTGRHDKRLTGMESAFVGVLWVDHVGRENAISAPDLAWAWALRLKAGIADQHELEEWKRDVRHMQNHLLFKHDQVPVLSMAGKGGGYWIAETEEEASKFYAAFRQRGMTGLMKGSRGRRAAVVEAVEQIAFEFEEMADKTGTGIGPVIRIEEGKELAPEIVDALLRKMSEEPERFASNLRKIREKYFSGAVLLKKDRLAAMQAKAAELQSLIGELQ